MGLLSTGYFFATGLAWLIVQGLLLVWLVPQLATLYADFEVTLPIWTTRLVRGSEWLAGQSPAQSLPGWWLAAPVAFFALLLLTAIGAKARPLLWLVALLGAATLIGEVYYLAAPLYGMLDNLNLDRP